MTIHFLFYIFQEAREPASLGDGFLDIGLLLLLTVIIAGFVAWRFIRKRKSPPVKPESDYEPPAQTPPPSVTIIRAADASGSSDRLLRILENLKSEQRIQEHTIVNADGDLSSLIQNVREEDMILIVLTQQLESQKEQIEKTVKPLQVRVAEIIVDNVVYDNAFIAFPTDLRPINGRQDSEAAWSGIEQTLREMFPVQERRAHASDPDAGNKRLEAIKNHLEYPGLIEAKPSSLRFYGRYGCVAIFGLIFTGGALFMGVVASGFMQELGASGFGSVLLLIFAVLGTGSFIYGLYRLLRLGTARLRAFPALILDKRTAVRGGGQSGSASTTYYVTLELESGERLELESSGSLYGTVTKDDAGVAYSRDRFLLDYRRLPV